MIDFARPRNVGHVDHAVQAIFQFDKGLQSGATTEAGTLTLGGASSTAPSLLSIFGGDGAANIEPPQIRLVPSPVATGDDTYLQAGGVGGCLGLSSTSSSADTTNCILDMNTARTVLSKTIAGLGSGTTHGTANFISVNRHATDCTAITDGVDGELCWEKDLDSIFACEPTAGGCDTAAEWIRVTAVGGANHNLLSATHSDTVAASPVLGDIPYGNVTPAWTKLAGQITTTKNFLTQTGTGAVSAVPVWGTIADGDLPSTIARDSEIILTNLGGGTAGANSYDFAAATMTRVETATGVPAAIECDSAGEVGSVRMRSDANAANATHYVCSQTSVTPTFAWELTQGAAGGGDSFTVNTVAVVDPDLDDATPAAPANKYNVNWQYSAPDISAYVDPTLFTAPIWGAGAGFTWTFNAGATDPQFIFASNSLQIGNAEVGVGDVPSSGYQFTITSTDANTVRMISSFAIGASSGAGIQANTSQDPSAADQRLGFFTIGSSGANALNAVGMVGYSAEDWTASAKGAYLQFGTTNIGAAARTEKLRLTDAGHILMGSDNVQDIGQSAALRPRTGYFATSLVAPTINATTGFQVAGAAASTAILSGNGTNFVAAQLGDTQIADGAVDGGTGGEIADGSLTSADLAAANKTIIKSGTVLSPVTGFTNYLQWYYPTAVTITRVVCSVAAATSVTIQLDERAEATPNTAGTDVMTSTLPCDVDSQATTTFTNATIAARVPLNVQITAVSGTPGAVRIHVEATID